MTSILDKPAKVDRESERLYFYAPGEVCVDICSGRPEDRKVVLEFLAQAQRAFGVLASICEEEALTGANRDVAAKVLSDAGVRR